MYIFHLSRPFFHWQIVRTRRVFRPALLRLVRMGCFQFSEPVWSTILHTNVVFDGSDTLEWSMLGGTSSLIIWAASNFVRRWSVKSCFSFSSAPTGEGVADLCPVACSIYHARPLAGTTYAHQINEMLMYSQVSWFCWFSGDVPTSLLKFCLIYVELSQLNFVA